MLMMGEDGQWISPTLSIVEYMFIIVVVVVV